MLEIAKMYLKYREACDSGIVYTLAICESVGEDFTMSKQIMIEIMDHCPEKSLRWAQELVRTVKNA